MKIARVRGREVLDSRGNPTVECDITLSDGSVHRAAVPSGASTGQHEAVELRDSLVDRYGGKGVATAVTNINDRLAPLVVGGAPEQKLDQVLIDADGTKDKSGLGANALLAVSMAISRAGAHVENRPLYEHLAILAGNKKVSLPVPAMNVINGGKHAGQENDIQEHMLVPMKADSFADAVMMGTEAYHELKKRIKKKFGSSLIGDEGGFAPHITNVRDRLDLLMKVVEETGHPLKLALDAAASEFFKEEKYHVGKYKYTRGELVDFYSDLVKTYPIVSLEDGMAEDDWDGWKALTKKIKVQIVGDDLLVTNQERIKKAVKESACNALLLKVNQIGTVSEAIAAAQLAEKHKWKVMVSHRSGETEDSFIADLVVGLGTGQAKFGAPARSDRNAKYNQLLRIEESELPLAKWD